MPGDIEGQGWEETNSKMKRKIPPNVPEFQTELCYERTAFFRGVVKEGLQIGVKTNREYGGFTRLRISLTGVLEASEFVPESS